MPRGSIVDFSASINPLGPPEWLRDVVLASLGDLKHYPDPECHHLVEAICARYGTAPEYVVVGNGSAEIIAALPRVLGVSRAVIPVPAYSDYAVASSGAGLTVENVFLQVDEDFALDVDVLATCLSGGEVVFVGRPNNPTGRLCSRDDLLHLVREFPRSWFVVDEAFVEFVTDSAGCSDSGLLTADLPNLVVTRSFTKLYAIPGLRLGFAVAPPVAAAALRRAMPPWSVNALAQVVGVAALADQAYVAATRSFVAEERGRLAGLLGSLPGIRVFPGSANYLLAKLDTKLIDARKMAGRLLRRGLAIRVCDDFAGLDSSYFRVAVRTRQEDDRLLEEIRTIVGQESPVFGKWPESTGTIGVK